jgi:hypothetical protein
MNNHYTLRFDAYEQMAGKAELTRHSQRCECNQKSRLTIILNSCDELCSVILMSPLTFEQNKLYPYVEKIILHIQIQPLISDQRIIKTPHSEKCEAFW